MATTQLTCMEGHPLESAKSDTGFEVECNVCKLKIRKNGIRHRCALCDWDLCNKCFNYSF